MIHPSFTLDQLTTGDDAMRHCLELAHVAARTDLPVLILGESGTGKTVLARALHTSSARAAAPFVSFTAAALSDTLLDSQLFGHEKGAFTGANKRVKGKFELAHTGTLFIDEIADMSSAAQAKILRAVEYGEYERLGSEAIEYADVRLVSATHLPIRRFIETDHFRRDLFYRISGLTITVPPLRDRPTDLRALVGTEITAAAQAQNKKIVGLSRQAAEKLFSYRWPGNLRELHRVIRTAVAMTSGDVIYPQVILLESESPAATSTQPAAAVAKTNAPPSDSTDLSLRGAESRHIVDVLARMGGCKRRAARALGVSRSTLDRKLAERARTGAGSAEVSITPRVIRESVPESSGMVS
jgi:transcriptional regulator with PAS, ATPase and Fis domain